MYQPISSLHLIALSLTSARADRRDNGDLITFLDLPLQACGVIIVKVDVLEVHGDRTAAQNLVLDARVRFIELSKEVANVERSRELLCGLASECRGSRKVQYRKVTRGSF
jgi:hypothetical protein